MVQAMEPRIIPRTEHGISRKQISPNALRTLYRLHDNGFIAYLVGGCVRDLLMERVPKDFDIATNATPSQIKRLFRNCRLIGRRFRLAHLHFQDEILEVSTFRASVPSVEGDIAETDGNSSPHHLKDEDGMVLRDNVFGTPEEDALRRDFTINALAYNIADFSVIDYSTGLSDLQQRIIRPIGDPDVRFTEDPGTNDPCRSFCRLPSPRHRNGHVGDHLPALLHHFPSCAGTALRRDPEALSPGVSSAGFQPPGGKRTS